MLKYLILGKKLEMKNDSELRVHIARRRALESQAQAPRKTKLTGRCDFTSKALNFGIMRP